MSTHTITNSSLVGVESPFSPCRRHSIGSGLHFLIDSLIEAYAIQASYSRHIKQGIAPGMAIRRAFKLGHYAIDSADQSGDVGTMQGEQEKGQ